MRKGTQCKTTLSFVTQVWMIIYLYASLVRLGSSCYYSDWTYFTISLVLWIIMKSGTIVQTLMTNTEMKFDMKGELIKIVFNTKIYTFPQDLLYQPCNKTFAPIVIYILIQECFSVWNIFIMTKEVSGDYFTIKIIHLAIGFILKSMVNLILLASNEASQLQSMHFLQLLSIFMTLTSLQGMWFILLLKFKFLLVALACKFGSILIQFLIIHERKYNVLGGNQNEPFRMFVSIAASQLTNISLDYAPFYQNNFQNKHYLQIDIATQISLSIIRAGQMLETLALLYLIHYYDLIPDSLKSLFIFFQSFAIISISLSLYHILRRLYENMSSDYRYLNLKTVSMQEFATIIKKSHRMHCLQIEKISDLKSLLPKSDIQNNDIFNDILRLTEVPHNFINVKNFLYKENNVFRFYLKYFENQYIKMIQNTKHLPPLFDKDYNSSSFNQTLRQSLLVRLFQFGIDTNFAQFVEQQPYQGKNNCIRPIIQQFSVDITVIALYFKLIAPYLQSNPWQALYDLRDD